MNVATRRWIRFTLTPVYWFGVTGVSYWVAWLLRFEFSIPERELGTFRDGLTVALIAKGVVFFVVGMRLEGWLRYSGFSDLVNLVRANLLAWAFAFLAVYSLIGTAFPRSVCCLDLLLSILASGGVRFAARWFHETCVGRRPGNSQRGLLIYGAGVAGLTLAREIRGNPALGFRVVGFLDDDERKHGVKLLGWPVFGSGQDAVAVVKSCCERRMPVDEIVVAMAAASGKQLRAAVQRGRAAGVQCRIVPGLGELISGKMHVGNMREISVTDLLGREPVQLDREKIRRVITGRSVLVTGAAGSIGSELCNQLPQHSPRQLVAVDQAESELFRLESDLRARYPGLSLTPEIADIRDPRRMEEIIEQYAVESIFHAAAYKHVPVMERNICEAVRNNIVGTWNVAQAAWRANVQRFLLISTDKAVNPSSVMGLTKRVAELLVTASRPAVGRGQATRFVCVRFGNVLVSNGSVVPIFQKQIAAGGPVTVTHPDMRRYFMTVEEAVQLVLEASAIGKGSEIFLLDMGKPVRIVELARKMITLAGLVPDEDIEIRFVGLRPGEKMFEELRFAGENLVPTASPKMRAFQGRQLAFDELVPWMAELQHLLWRRDGDAVLKHVRILVPEYQPVPQFPAADVGELVAPARVLPASAELARAFRTAAG
jgi:FlaA1/EpsC-like NDP-sugar epimerase